MTTLAIISDTHGHLHADIESLIKQSDYAAHAGDICGSHVLERCQPRKKMFVVAGNSDFYCHDGFVDDQALDFELEGVKFSLDHGHQLSPDKPMLAALSDKHPQADVIIFGHTHKLTIERNDAQLLLNPGAAGLTRTDGMSKCLLLDIKGGVVTNVSSYQFPIE